MFLGRIKSKSPSKLERVVTFGTNIKEAIVRTYYRGSFFPYGTGFSFLAAEFLS
jgi:hypothetical protein